MTKTSTRKKYTQRRFDGGVAQDIRATSTNQYSYAKNFDTISYQTRIVPYVTMETESITTGALADFRITDAVVHKDSLDQNIFFLGRKSSVSENAKIFQKQTAMTITAQIAPSASGEDTTNNVIAGTLASYKERLYFCVTDFTNTYVRNYNRITATLGATGTISGYGVQTPRPFRHPQDDILYFGAGNKIAKWNNSTFTADVGLVLPSDMFVTSLTDYGAYLAIAMSPVSHGISKVFLWDVGRQTTIPQEIIDFGEGRLSVLENLNGVLVGVMANIQPTTASVFTSRAKIFVKGYTGGAVEVIREVTGTDGAITLNPFKAKINNRLMFSAKLTINGATINQIFAVARTSLGWSLHTGHIPSTTDISGEILGFNFIGDYLWCAFDNGSYFRTRFTTETYPSSVLETLINPAMPLEDRGKRKNLVSVKVGTSRPNATLSVEYRVDGGSYVSLGSVTSSGGNIAHFLATNESSGAPFLDGYDYQFRITSQSGADITEFSYSCEELGQLI